MKRFRLTFEMDHVVTDLMNEGVCGALRVSMTVSAETLQKAIEFGWVIMEREACSRKDWSKQSVRSRFELVSTENAHELV